MVGVFATLNDETAMLALGEALSLLAVDPDDPFSICRFGKKQSRHPVFAHTKY